MPTINQLIRKPRKKQTKKSKSPALQGCPQKSGVVIKTYIRKPKKPNSGERKVALVKLSTGKRVICSIPGEAHSIAENQQVLVRGGRRPDQPGVCYQIIIGERQGCPERGVYYYDSDRKPRKQGRSKYGVKRIREKQ